MPTPQTQSQPPNANTLSSTDQPNGITQDGRNGAAGKALPNGLSRDGEVEEGAAADALRAQKQKAKAHIASPAPTSKSTDVGMSSATPNRLPNGHIDESQSITNGGVQSRKRSRSGTLIRRSPEESAGMAMDNDSSSHDAPSEAVKLNDALDRDMIHRSATILDGAELEALCAFKKDEADLHMALRGRPVPQYFPPEVSVSDDFRKADMRLLLRPGPIRDPNEVRRMFGDGFAFNGGRYRDPRQPRSSRGAVRKSLLSRKELRKHAELLDELVPIRLDIEWEHTDLGKIRLRDTFTWNFHERIIKPRLFAETLVEDFGLSLQKCNPLVDMVAASIEEQISEHYPHIFIDDGPADPHQPYTAYKDDELRITIKLNITIGQHTLVDQFEWDINNSSEAAETFARQMAQELSLSGEFTTAIAHAIREQCQLFTRSLYVVDHTFDGRPVIDEDIRSGLGPSPLPSAFRTYSAAKEYTPYLYELNDTELEKTELSHSREQRLQKRSVNRRGGPSLPDIKDRQRTIRTLVLSSVIPGAAETLEETKIFKRAPAAKSRKHYGKDGNEDSDELDSEESSPEEVIPAQFLSGTARTRGMRGAATAAQQAMRGVVGRSATPETAPQDARTPARRTVAKDYREDSGDEEPTSLIVKLRIPKDRFKRFLQDMGRNKNKNLNLERGSKRSQGPTSGHGTAGGATPSRHHGHHGSPAQLRDGQPVNPIHPHAAQLGRVDASGPPTPENPAPPPPPWLLHALERLQQSWPNDKFEGLMRYTPVSLETDLPASRGEADPNSIKYMYYPRIKCLDCPGKNYTPGPETGVSNFEVHLRNKQHREKVEARVALAKKESAEDKESGEGSES